MSLCEEAEQYIKTHKKNLQPATRARLATFSPKEQVQWLVNPMVMFCLSKVQASIWTDVSQGVKTVEVVKTAKVETETPPDESDSDHEDDMTFGLFD